MNDGIRPLRILLVEDSPSDIRLVQEALRSHPTSTLEVVRDGEAAVAFVRREVKGGKPTGLRGRTRLCAAVAAL